MPNFCRHFDSGGFFFVTVVTYQRQSVLLHTNVRNALKAALQTTHKRFPFKIHAMVLLPDHFHAIIELPDPWLPQRIGMIKRITTQQSNFQSDLKLTDNERFQRRGKLWQPRYWEHRIVSERRYQHQLMYCYTNPVKHKLVECVGDWPYSTFHRDVRLGLVPEEWGAICWY